jgi:hypothetical protein
VADVWEVLQHWQAGHSLRQLSRNLGMDRDRLRQIVATAEAAGLSPGGVSLSRHEWEEPVPQLFGERLAVPVSEQERRIAQLHEMVVQGLITNTASTVWQRLRDEHGLTVSVATFGRYVRKHVRAVRPEDVTVRKVPTPPGQVAEVDYGRLARGRIRAPVRGTPCRRSP